jgi:hypothetical protein
VEGSADDHQPVDIAAMLRDSDLSADNRRHLNAGGAARLIALLVERDHELVYLPGRTVHASAA